MLVKIGEVTKIPFRVSWEEALTSEARLREYIYQNTNVQICYPFWTFPRYNPYLDYYLPQLTKNKILKQYHIARELMAKGIAPADIKDPYGRLDNKSRPDLTPRQRLLHDLKVILWRKQEAGKRIAFAKSWLEQQEHSLATKRHNQQYQAKLEAGIEVARNFLQNPPPVKGRPEISWRELLKDSSLFPEYLYQHSGDSHPLNDYENPWHYWRSEDPLFSGEDLLPQEYLIRKYEDAIRLLDLGIRPEDIPDPVYERYLQPDPEPYGEEKSIYELVKEEMREKEAREKAWRKAEKEKERLAAARGKMILELCAILDRKIAMSGMKKTIQEWIPAMSVLKAKQKLAAYFKRPKLLHPEYKSWQLHLADVLADEELLDAFLLFQMNDCLRPLLWDVKVCFPIKPLLDREKRKKLQKLTRGVSTTGYI